MTDKDLKRLRRDELLEMLIAQSKRTDQLQAELDAARAQLASRAIVLEEAGSIAEAALRINGVFEAAQAAAAGDPSQLMSIMDQLMHSKEGAELMDRIGSQARKAGLK